MDLGKRLTFATATGVLRVMSDQHYATDVLAGMAAGGLAGWLNPKLHKPGAVRRYPLAMVGSAAGSWLVELRVFHLRSALRLVRLLWRRVPMRTPHVNEPCGGLRREIEVHAAQVPTTSRSSQSGEVTHLPPCDSAAPW